MDEILGMVSKSLSATTATTPSQSASSTNGPRTVDEYELVRDWEHDTEDAEFDDLGQGVGVEGDLDMEDDD